MATKEMIQYIQCLLRKVLFLYWLALPSNTGYGLCLSAEEMSKVGLLCLKKGIFNNKRIVSEKWLEESTMVRLCCGEKFRGMKYGYLWWIIDENEGSYAAIGNSGNVIYINPQKELVVAVSGYFKPTVFDRIDFIKGQIEEKLLGEHFQLCPHSFLH